MSDLAIIIIWIIILAFLIMLGNGINEIESRNYPYDVETPYYDLY